MLVRIENAGITRGREFALYAYSNIEPSATLYAFNPINKEYVQLEYVKRGNSNFHIFEAVAPHFDGYLMAVIGNQKIIKRIGTPLVTAFIYGYKDGYTLPYKLYDKDVNVIGEGILKHIVDGFYYTIISDNVMMVEAQSRKFMISKNIAKLNYEVTMTGGSINSTFDNATIGDVPLPDVALPNVELKDAMLDSTLPEVEIKEL